MSVWDDLAVEVHPGVGPYALFVHGFLSSRSHWIPNLAALGEVCRPVVVEQYGHGRAASLADVSRLTPEAYCLAFEEIRTRLGVDRWFVIGHSLGGAITSRYAIDYPERVFGHVFTNSQSAFADDGWVSATVRSTASLVAQLEGPTGSAVLAAHPMHPRSAGRIDPAVRMALSEDYSAHDRLGIAALLRHTLPVSSVRTIAYRNSRPALLTIGTSEGAFVETARHVEAVMPLLEMARFDAGHNVNLHRPDEWNSEVGAFLVRHAG